MDADEQANIAFARERANAAVARFAGGGVTPTAGLSVPVVGLPVEEPGALTRIASTRAAEMRERRGLPASIIDQVDENGNPLTSREWRLRAGTLDDTADPGVGRATRALGIQEQRFRFMQGPGVAMAAEAMQGVGLGGAASALPLAAGGVLALVTATALLAMAFKSATDAAMAMSREQFQLTAQLRGSISPGATGAELERLTGEGQRLGIRRGEIGPGLSALALAGATPEQARYTTTLGEDIARSLGRPVGEVIAQLVQAQMTGEAGGLAQFMPGVIYGATPVRTANELLLQKYGGAAEAFALSPQGRMDVAGAELEASWERIGEELLPVAVGVTDAFTKMLPALEGTAKGLTLVTDVLGAMAKTLGDAVGWVVNLVPSDAKNFMGWDDFTGNLGKGYDFIKSRIAGTVGGPTEYQFNPATGQFDYTPAGGGTSGGAFGPTGPAPKPPFQPQPLPPFMQSQQERALIGQGQLITTPLSEITAVRQVAEEVEGTITAITGVQDVFSKLTTFYVDWEGVRPNLENLQKGIIELQKWWIDVAQGATGITMEQNQRLKAYLDAVGSMVGVLTGGSQAFQDLYMASGLMPDESQMQVFVDRLGTMFDALTPVAEKAMNAADPNLTGKVEGYVRSYAETMQAVGQLVIINSEAFTKMAATPLPSDALIDATVDRTVALLDRMTTALMEAFTKQDGTVTANLGNAALLAGPATTILQMASMGEDVIRKMTNLYLPPREVIGQIVDRVLLVSNSMADAMGEAIASEEQKPAEVRGDTLLQKAGQRAQNMLGLVQVLGAGVSAIASMRNVVVPEPGTIARFVDATLAAGERMAAGSAGLDANQLDQMKRTGEALGPAMSAFASGVGALREMRDLAMPGEDQMASFFRGFNVLVSHSRAMDADTAAKVQQGGQAMGATMQALLSGAQALGGIHEAVMPSEQEMDQFWGRFTAAASGMSRFSQQFSQQAADRGTDVGNALQAQFGALSTATGWLAQMHELLVPSEDLVDEVFNLEMRIADRLMKRAQGFSVDYTKNAEDYGKALTAVLGAVSQGGDILDRMPRIHPIPVDMIDQFFDGLDAISVRMTERAQMRQQRGDLVPEQVSKDLTSEFSAITAAAEAINSIGIVRFDVAGPIDVLFDNLEDMHVQFQARFGSYKDVASKQTHDLAIGITEEMNAINAAIEPLSNMDKASRVGPGMVDAVMRNARYMVSQFATFGEMPELQGEGRARLAGLADIVGEIGGSLNNMVQAVSAMSKPQSAIGQQNAMNLLQQALDIGTGPGRGAFAGPGGRGGVSGGTFTNCIIIDGEVVFQGAEVEALVGALSAREVRKQGGVPVQNKR
jgi:hypothetical protein